MIRTVEYNADTGVLEIYSRAAQPQEVLATATVPDLYHAHEIMRAVQQLYDEGLRLGWARAALAAKRVLEEQS